MHSPTDGGLVRGIRRWDLVALVLNAVIGSGIFGLPATIYAQTGTWSLIVFLACAFLIVLIILCFAEVGSRFRDTGGPYLYTRAAFGSLVGFEVGWLLWLARITAFAALTALFINYLAVFWPAASEPAVRAGIITAIIATVVTINILGVRNSAIVIDMFTVAKMVPLILLVVVGIFFVDPENFSFATRPTPAGFSEGVLLAVFAFSGFETAVIPAGETKDPTRQMPFALLTGTAIIVLLYIAIQFVAIGTVPDLANSERPLADAGRVILGPVGATIVIAGALVSIGGTLNSISLAAPRLVYALAEQRQFPAFLARTHSKFRTPYIAIILSGIVMWIVTLQGDFIGSLTISTIIRLLTYAAVCAALIRLRWKKDAPPPAFHAPLGIAAAVGALALCGWLFKTANADAMRDTAIVGGVGLVLYGLHNAGRHLLKGGQR